MKCIECGITHKTMYRLNDEIFCKCHLVEALRTEINDKDDFLDAIDRQEVEILEVK